MKKIQFLLTVFMLGIVSANAQTDIVITEIGYDQAETGPDSTEFIELYNKGLVAVDMEGYSFSAGVSFTFPSIIIEPGAFVVVAVDSLAMVSTYGYIGAYQWTSGFLTDGGEAITLRDSDGVLVDALLYNDVSPWPVGAAGTGKTVVFCDPEMNNAIGANWVLSETNAGIVVNDLDVYGSPGAIDEACIPCEETTATLDLVVCEAYTVPSGDETYDVSGVYMDTIPNMDECDSVITINLTVATPTASSFSVVACNAYTLPSGDITYMFSTVINDTIPNALGCDSVMTIDITVNYSSTSEITETACNEYVVPSGDETYTVSGVYSDTIPNVSDCDSIITINLTVNLVDDNVTKVGFDLIADQDDATYQWVDCDNDNVPIDGATEQTFTPTEDGNYAVEVTLDGCTVLSDCVNFNALGIDDVGVLSQVEIYPNPTKGSVNIDFGDLTNATVKIIGVDGRVVQEFFQESNANVQVELGESTGLYYIFISHYDSQKQFKLIVE